MATYTYQPLHHERMMEDILALVIQTWDRETRGILKKDLVMGLRHSIGARHRLWSKRKWRLSKDVVSGMQAMCEDAGFDLVRDGRSIRIALPIRMNKPEEPEEKE